MKQPNERGIQEVDLVYRTMFAELGERAMDAAFESDFALSGRFVPVAVKGRRYWYFDKTTDGVAKRIYVGPAGDEAITRRVESFKALKDDHRSRRKLVSTLVREAGFPRPEAKTGEIVSALAKAGIFRLRGVLVGTVAFQCLSGLLGVRLPSAAIQTSDADFAQFHAISAAVGDSLPPVLDLLKAIDPSFREIAHVGDGRVAAQFVSRAGYRVEFLTPNTGKDDYENGPAVMPALGGAAAQPLRFLDFLIHEPVRSVMLHGAGVSVTVPAPERFAIHKLIVAARRRRDAVGNAKIAKDLQQASMLASALASTRRQGDLAAAFIEATERGPAWRAALGMGLSYLTPARQADLKAILRAGLQTIDVDPKAIRLDLSLGEPSP